MPDKDRKKREAERIVSEQMKSEQAKSEQMKSEQAISENAKIIEEMQTKSDRKSVIFDDGQGKSPFSVDKGGVLGRSEVSKTDKGEKIETETMKRAKKNVRDRDRTVLLEKVTSRIVFALKVIPFAFIVLLAAAVIIQLAVLTTTRVQTEQYLEETDRIEDDMATRMDEVNDDYVSDRILQILSQNDLYVYTNSLWDYSLTANGTDVNDMEIGVEADGAKVRIVLTEERAENTLPDPVVDVGSVTRGDKNDKIERHIGVKSAGAGDGSGGAGEEVVPAVTQNGSVMVYTFEINGVKAGDEILITLSDQLGAKLNMPFSEITILVLGDGGKLHIAG